MPDELVSSGNSWGEQLGGNKPPAQGPGPGGPINGEDPGVPNIALQRQLQQQQLQHLMQQGNKNAMVGNISGLGMGQLGSKSPNLQSSLNAQSSMANNHSGVGMNSMQMSIANNGTQSMGTMQGNFNKINFKYLLFFFFLIIFIKLTSKQ